MTEKAPQNVEAAPAGAADPSPQDVWNDLEKKDAEARGETYAPPAEAADSDGAQAPIETDKPETKPETKPEDQPVAAQPTTNEGAAKEELWEQDPVFANATPEQKAAIERMRQTSQSANGRYAAVQRQLNEIRGKAATRPPMDKKAVDRVAKAKEGIAKLKDDYPEIAGPVSELVDAVGEDLEQRGAAEERERQEATRAIAADTTEQKKKLETMLPGWRKKVASPAEAARFAEWADDQPKAIRDAARRNAKTIVDAEEAAGVISKFFNHLEAQAGPQPGAKTPGEEKAAAAPATETKRQEPDDRRQRQLAASASPGRSMSITPTKAPSTSDPQAIWDFYEAEDQRKAATAGNR